MAARGYSASIRRRRLSIELRRLREQAGKTLEDVARVLECSSATVSRIETGRTPVKVRDVQTMLRLFGVDDTEADALANLAKEPKGKGWWHFYSDVLPHWFSAYVGLENDAVSMRTYEPQLVPGLLQTHSYARAVLRASLVFDPDEVERRVEVRLARQAALRRPDPLQLWVVIDEAALRRPVGGGDVMRHQLKTLGDMVELPNVTIQVLPLAVGAHPAMVGGFAILSFAETVDLDVVYLDSHSGGILTDVAADTARYHMMFDYVRAKAEDPDRTAEILASVAKELP